MSDPKKTDRQERLEGRPTLAEDVQLEGGRAGGKLAREVGTRDHLKRAFERPAGKTRVEGRHEKDKD